MLCFDLDGGRDRILVPSKDMLGSTNPTSRSRLHLLVCLDYASSFSWNEPVFILRKSNFGRFCLLIRGRFRDNFCWQWAISETGHARWDRWSDLLSSLYLGQWPACSWCTHAHYTRWIAKRWHPELHFCPQTHVSLTFRYLDGQNSSTNHAV